MRVFSGIAAMGLLLGACSVNPDAPKASKDDSKHAADFERAARLAGLKLPLPQFQFEGAVTPSVPMDGGLSLRSAEPVLWNPADGAAGSIELANNGNANAGSGSRVGLDFEAQAGRRYLALCGTAEPSGAKVTYLFGGAATGYGNVQMSSAEFPAVSDRVETGDPATFDFHLEQGGNRIVGCRLFSMVTA